MTEIDLHIKSLLDKKDLQNPKSFEDLGYCFFGPLLFNFFIWLKPSLKNCDKLLFNSREGNFLIEIYKLFKDKFLLPNYTYFLTSRKISTISTIFEEKDIYDTFKLHRYSGTLSSLLKDRFGIDVKVENDYLIDTKVEIPDLSLYSTDIIKNANRVRKEYEIYVKKIIGNSQNIIMIDSGFQGTTQYNIEKAFGIKCAGRYITYKGNLPLKNTEGFCDFNKTNFKDNIIFFESVFTDEIGTYIDIFDGKFVNENIETSFYKEKQKVIEGIKEFINEMFLIFDIVGFDIKSVNYEYSDFIFNLMCKKDFIKNKSLFDIFSHDNYYVRNTIKKVNRK